jgi:uncharacterized protein (TIGR01777 family)
MRIFVTGGTGLVGGRLIPRLRERGDEIIVVTRHFAHARQVLGPDIQLVEGDPGYPGDWMQAIDDCDAVINLAGENLFSRRWSAAFKTVMYDSRINSTRHVVEALKRVPRRSDEQPKVLIHASAIGLYGAHGDEELTENAPVGPDFLAQLCLDWEKMANTVATAGVRLAIVRIGVVLDRRGGALSKLLTPFKLFFGGPVGSGRQWMSWIHHEDLTELLLMALDRADATGAINGTAPNPVTNKQFARALGQALQRPSFMWTPGFLLRTILGEVANVVLTGQRVLPRRALGLGYTFKFPTIDEALKNVLS